MSSNLIKVSRRDFLPVPPNSPVQPNEDGKLESPPPGKAFIMLVAHSNNQVYACYRTDGDGIRSCLRDEKSRARLTGEIQEYPDILLIEYCERQEASTKKKRMDKITELKNERLQQYVDQVG